MMIANRAASLATLLLAVGGLSALGADTLVVCPPEFRSTLKPWIEHRTRQGYSVSILNNSASRDEQRQAIRSEARRHKLRFLLLVGDTSRTPACLTKSTVTVRWGSEPEIASDNGYADLDDDQIPDLAVGRLTADSPDELAAMIRKIIAYETAAASGAWIQRINFIAGLGGFGGLADAAIEACAKKFICDGVPAAYQTTMTYASWRSPYCPDPRLFGQTAIERLNEGCLFWVYIGHGHAWGLDHVQVPGGQFSILELADVRRVRCRHGSPIALLLSCHAGAFDAQEDCLAEELLRSETGPVAAVCGSRVTMPYGMAVLCGEALKECFQEHRATLGEMLLAAKRNSILQPRTSEDSRALDALATTLNAGADLAEERREHLHLINLLGDPLLQLPHPKSITLAIPESAAPGDELAISGTCNVDGLCTIDLVAPRDRLTFRPSPRREFEPTNTALTAYQETYLKANDGRLASTQATIDRGVFTSRLTIPSEARGECHVRVSLSSGRDFAHGGGTIKIVPKTKR